jgi:hypothetical protein
MTTDNDSFFYFDALPAQEQTQVDRVSSVQDLTPEIATLRTSLVRLLADPAARPSDLVRAARALACVLRTQARIAPPRVMLRTSPSIQGQTTSILGDPHLLHQALHDGLDGPGTDAETTPAKAGLTTENKAINERQDRSDHAGSEERRPT